MLGGCFFLGFLHECAKSICGCYGFSQPVVIFLALRCSCSSMFLILFLLTFCQFSLDWGRVGCSMTLVCSDALGGGHCLWTAQLVRCLCEHGSDWMSVVVIGV